MRQHTHTHTNNNSRPIKNPVKSTAAANSVPNPRKNESFRMKDDITENEEAARRTKFSLYCGPRSRTLHSAQPASEPWPKKTPKFFCFLKTQRNIECIIKKTANSRLLAGRYDWKFLHKTCALVCTLPQWSLVGTGTSPSQKANLHTKHKSSSTCMCTENEIYTKAQTPFLHVGISKNK
jgi:hypothetical protein